jgi:lipopolysaccharide/colanic/teichoic acid biosynthesis glycosyltransferase
MTKRLSDILLSALLLAIISPVLGVAMFLIWAHDGHSPLYWSVRVGRGGRDFRMAKLRSMAVDAELKGGASTARSDERITPIGTILRRWKLDELPQFWNVLKGEMSIVGPRPNTRRGGVDRYTADEMRLLSARPGITDLSSIMFLDEADILDCAADPDVLYDLAIRPWKSQLGLLYIDRRSHVVDLQIICLTVIAIVAKPLALKGLDSILAKWGASGDLRCVCRYGAVLPLAEPSGQAA